MKLLYTILLLTASLAIDICAFPIPKVTLEFPRNENATILELIAQYKQFRLQADQAEKTRTALLEQADAKKVAIESQLGFTSTLPPLTTLSTAITKTSINAQTYTVLAPIGSSVFYMSQGTTRTVSADMTTVATVASTPGISKSSSPADHYTILTATGSVVAFASRGTTKTVTLNTTATTISVISTNKPDPVSVITATGSKVALAPLGITTTLTMSATISGISSMLSSAPI